MIIMSTLKRNSIDQCVMLDKLLHALLNATLALETELVGQIQRLQLCLGYGSDNLSKYSFSILS